MQTRTMVIIGVIVVALIGLLLVGPCFLTLGGRPLSFSAIQEVGGIKPLAATRDQAGSVFLLLRCDLSGLEPVTVEPKRIEGLGGFDHIESTVAGRTIFVTVYKRGLGPALAPPVHVGQISAGTYEIVYRSPNEEDVSIGTVVVP